MSGIIINPYRFAATGLDPAAFVTEWTVGAGDTIKLYSYDASPSGFTMDYDVDWGDSSSDSNVTTVDKTHTYSSAGTYQVVITNQFGSLNMSRASVTEKGYLTNMVQWGTDNVWSSLYKMFESCTLMEYTATDSPNLTALVENTQMRQTFYNCESAVNLDLSNWTNTSNITYMYYAFGLMDSLRTLNLTGWDTSNVTYIGNMCYQSGDPVNGCDFTMPSLDMSSATTATNVFRGCFVKSMDISGWTWRAAGISLSSFLQDIDEGSSSGSFTINAANWLPASGGSITNLASFLRNTEATSIDLTGIDTSNVTTFSYAFYYNLNLTHITGLSSFDASSVTTIDNMFRQAKVLNFGAGVTTNFGSDWGPNLGSCANFTNTFLETGLTTPGSAVPYVTNWDVSGATNMTSVFYNLKWTGGGNPDTSAWEIPGTVTTLANFIRGSSFTELDLSNANVDFSGVTNFTSFAHNTTGLTRFILNGTLAKPGFTSVTLLNNAFYTVTLATGDYDELLLKLDNGGQSTVTLNGGSSKYSAGAAATARASLVTKGWTITDGGPA
tara:strand:- start:309 stop:1967 length:1659 start_codon:yes stop_codon:yes gene_type:complete